MQSKGKRVLIAGIAGTAVFGAVIASAASLGGFVASDLGAANSVVAACNGGAGGITAKWVPTYAAPGPNYGSTKVTIAGLSAACDGQLIKVQLTQGGPGVNAPVPGGAFTGTVGNLSPDPSGTFSATGTIDDEAVTGVSVVVYEP